MMPFDHKRYQGREHFNCALVGIQVSPHLSVGQDEDADKTPVALQLDGRFATKCKFQLILWRESVEVRLSSEKFFLDVRKQMQTRIMVRIARNACRCFAALFDLLFLFSKRLTL